MSVFGDGTVLLLAPRSSPGIGRFTGELGQHYATVMADKTLILTKVPPELWSSCRGVACRFASSCQERDAGESKPGRPDMVPDILNLVIWLIAGIAGGNAAGDLLKGDYDLGPGNTIAGGIGGVIGAAILQILIPGLRDFDIGPVLGQVIAAAASGAALTVVAAVMRSRRMF